MSRPRVVVLGAGGHGKVVAATLRAAGREVAAVLDDGEGALVGVGSAVLPGIAIGRWAVVGGGATVARYVADERTVAGTPARPLGDA